eukprot:1141730-Pelagomonas_calceolata.AAC.1
MSLPPSSSLCLPYPLWCLCLPHRVCASLIPCGVCASLIVSVPPLSLAGAALPLLTLAFHTTVWLDFFAEPFVSLDALKTMDVTPVSQIPLGVHRLFTPIPRNP